MASCAGTSIAAVASPTFPGARLQSAKLSTPTLDHLLPKEASKKKRGHGMCVYVCVGGRYIDSEKGSQIVSSRSSFRASPDCHQYSNTTKTNQDPFPRISETIRLCPAVCGVFSLPLPPGPTQQIFDCSLAHVFIIISLSF